MSTVATTNEDYRFYDELAPIVFKKNTSLIPIMREYLDAGIIQIESMLETALAYESNGAYSRVAGLDDFTDGSDAKKVVSQYRNNRVEKKVWTNSCIIRNVSGKSGMIRAMMLSKYSNKFYYAAIPREFYSNVKSIEFPMDQFVGAPGTPLGMIKSHSKWAPFLVDSFKELATATEESQTIKVRNEISLLQMKPGKINHQWSSFIS